MLVRTVRIVYAGVFRPPVRYDDMPGVLGDSGEPSSAITPYGEDFSSGLRMNAALTTALAHQTIAGLTWRLEDLIRRLIGALAPLSRKLPRPTTRRRLPDAAVR
jgi:hypothetical protein